MSKRIGDIFIDTRSQIYQNVAISTKSVETIKLLLAINTRKVLILHTYKMNAWYV
jgi:hypothetical protein